MRYTPFSRPRRMVWLVLRCIIYVFLIVGLYQGIVGGGNLFRQFFLVSFLLIISSYLAIDLQYIDRKWWWLVGVSIMLINAIMIILYAASSGITQGSGWLALIAPAGVMLLLHLGILLLMHEKLHVLVDRRTVNGWAFLKPGVSVFAVSMAAMFALLTAVRISVERVDCDMFYRAADDVVRFLGSPFLLGVEATQRAEGRIEKLRTQNIGELTGMEGGDLQRLQQESLASLQNLGERLTGGAGENVPEEGGILALFQEYKHRFVDEIVNDQSKVNQGVCTLILGEVEKKLEKPGFRISIAVLLFFIFSPLLSFLFWVILVVGWIVFELLYFLGVWHREKMMVEMDVLK